MNSSKDIEKFRVVRIVLLLKIDWSGEVTWRDRRRRMVTPVPTLILIEMLASSVKSWKTTYSYIGSRRSIVLSTSHWEHLCQEELIWTQSAEIKDIHVNITQRSFLIFTRIHLNINYVQGHKMLKLKHNEVSQIPIFTRKITWYTCAKSKCLGPTKERAAHSCYMYLQKSMSHFRDNIIIYDKFLYFHHLSMWNCSAE